MLKRYSKIIILVLASFMFMAMNMAIAIADDSTVGYKKIFNAEELLAINDDPSGNYILMADIDLSDLTKKGGDYDSGNGWQPLDTFGGILDGNGFRIKGMNLYGTISLKRLSTSGGWGLFEGMNAGAVVKNLALTDINIDVTTRAESDYYEYGSIGKQRYLSIAGIAGYCESESSISNCYVTGDIIVNGKDENDNDVIYVDKNSEHIIEKMSVLWKGKQAKS